MNPTQGAINTVNPTQGAINKIVAYVATMSGGWSNSNAQILAAYNAPAVANPVPQAIVPTPYTYMQLLSCLSQASAANLEAFPGIFELSEQIAANDTPAVSETLAFLLASGKVQSNEATAITAILTATEPDPNYQSLVPQSVIDLGRLADFGDIASARAAS